MLRVAAAQYPITAHADLNSWRDKQRSWVKQAAHAGAKVLVFPEYAPLELTSVLPNQGRDLSLNEQLQQIQTQWPAVRQTYAELAQQHQLWILGGTLPEFSQAATAEAPATSTPQLKNAAHLFAPSGQSVVQHKLQMTRFETDEWQVTAGSGGIVVQTPWGNLAIAICYDIEFPLIARRLVEHGADVILVPSCTDTMAGHHRVTIGSRARAMENQCYVAQAATVGLAPWLLALDENHGAAAVFSPVDRGFPDDGIVAKGEIDSPGWVYADLDLTSLARVRRDGQVRNFADFSLPAHLSGEIHKIPLKIPLPG